MRIRNASLAFAALLGGCVSFPDPPAPTTAPHLGEASVTSVDGEELGLTRWTPAEPEAVLVAVHGMNDYARAFSYAGPYFAERGVAVYAYDQRGFGRSPEFGRWPGARTLQQDLRAVIAAVRAEHDDLPVFVIGHSMGAAVVMAAMHEAPLDVEGVILAAPGVWGGAGMPLFYRATLNLAAMVAPGKTLTGERAGRQASDNIAFLRTMYDDPLIIKETRLDAVLGVERIMGDAFDASDEIGGDILIVYGEKDEIIPVKMMRKAARRICGAVETRVYPESWHLIVSDLQRMRVLNDIGGWIDARKNAWRPQEGTGDSGPAAASCAAGRGHGEPAKAGD